MCGSAIPAVGLDSSVVSGILEATKFCLHKKKKKKKKSSLDVLLNLYHNFPPQNLGLKHLLDYSELCLCWRMNKTDS